MDEELEGGMSDFLQLFLILLGVLLVVVADVMSELPDLVLVVVVVMTDLVESKVLVVAALMTDLVES